MARVIPWSLVDRLGVTGLVLAILVFAGLLAGTARAANITSIATGNWNTTGTWSSGTVPGAFDNVTIANGHTVTIDLTSASCQSLTVGQGVSGVLQFSATTARTLTVGGDVTIAAGGTFQSATSGTVTTHVLSVAGSLTNNGTLDFSTNGNTAGAGITFTGGLSASFSGTGATTDIRTLTINKGASSAIVLELMPSSFTVQGTSTDGSPSAYLTLTNGTFKISGTFTGTHRTFTTATYTIPATGGLWLNNPNYTVAGQAGGPTNNGLLRITQGTVTVGTATGNVLGAGAGATFTIEGGTLNIASRFLTSNAITYTQSGGTVNVTTVGNGTNGAAGFDLGSSSNSFSMSGGTIVLVQASTSSANKRDYAVNAGTVSITGGTLQVGAAATTSGSNLQIAGFMPSLVVDNTTNTKTATVFTGAPASQALNVTINSGSTLNLNGFTLKTTGTTVTNNGTLTGTTTGSQLYFVNASLAQTYTGTGTVTAPLDSIAFESPAGVTISSGAPSIVTLNAKLHRGTVTNSNKLTLGNGGATAALTMIGKPGLATAGGAYDVAPTFNAGTGGYSVSYQPEGGSRTTGLEIPGSRIIQNLTANNANGVTLSGGGLTVNGSATINAGTSLNLNGLTLTMAGATFTNNGTLTGTVAGSTLYFLGSAAQSYTGTGAVTSPLDVLSFDTPAGVTINSGVTPNVTALTVNLYRGTVTNSNKLTLGNGGTSAPQTVIGRTGLATAGGSYGAAPTFNAGTGGYSVSYQPEGSARTMGLEIPASRTITNLTVNNANGVTLAGGGLTVTGMTTNSGATLNLGGLTLTVTGSTFTHNGTLTGTTAGSTLYFLNESVAQTYTGTGTITAPLDGISFDNPAGVTLPANLTVLNARLFRGTVTNSNRITLGNGGATAAQTVIGRSGLTAAAGTYDVAPTFNAGTGGYSVSYQPEGGARTTGFEIPASRSVRNLTVNNANGVTLAGGGLTVTGVLTFTSGNFATGASTLALSATGSVVRTSGHVVGNLRKNVATGSSVSRTFEIGTGGDYAPATALFASVTTAGDLTATTVAGDHPNLAGSVVNPIRSVNRYWTLSNAGVGFTTYDATFNFVAGDIDAGSGTGNFVVARYNNPTWFTTSTGTRTSTSTQATGVTSFSDFAVGENSHVITASAGSNGSISPAGTVVVQDGASQAFTITPSACYRVSDVLVDGLSVGPVTTYTFTNVSGDHTISASFVNLFTIAASAGAHGSISPSGAVSVVCGNNQGFTITADDEFHIADVLVDGVSVGAVTGYTFTNVTSDHTIAASFAYDNVPPALSGVPTSATIPELAAYSFTATATDPESPPETLTFSLVGEPAGASIDGASGVFTWTPTEPQGPGSYPFTVRVSDGRWNTDATITLTVTEANLVPVLSGVPSSATIAELAPYSFTASASDEDLPAQTLVFSLVGAPAGAAIDPGTGVFTWTPSEAQGPGSYPFTVRVSDGMANTDAGITLTVDEVNAAPTLPGVPALATIPEQVLYALNTGGTDSDIPVQTLTFSLLDAPAGAAIDPGTGILTWTPSETQGPGEYPFTVRVTDGVMLTEAAITLTVSEVNVPPVLSGVPATTTIVELAPYTFTAGATDEDLPVQTLVYSLVGAPAGAAIDPGTGVFTWTPGEAQGPGSYPFTVRVSDGVANTDAAITLTVDESNVPPVPGGVPASATIPEAAAYTFTATATDSDLPAQTLTFSLVGAPAGAAIGPSTGVFTWTPSEIQGPGEYPFTVRVSDGLASVDAAITLTVEEVNVAPVLSGVPANVTIPELAPYTLTALATDADVPVQTLTFSLVGAPTGAAIDPSTGVFAWTPDAAQAGVHTFAVRVSDGMINTDAGITITVEVLPITDLAAIQIKSGNDGDGTTRIRVDWSALPVGHTVEVFRAGFGGYPTYDGAGGQVPVMPSYPPGAPWALTAVTTSGEFDEVATRDFYYYVAFVHGAASAVSIVSNRTSGTLNYHLGDVSDGATPGQGDNSVTTADLSLLGAHYALEGAEAAPYAYLDVGPTTDYSLDALPTTDGVIDFEDLIVLAINVDAVSAPAGAVLAGSTLAQAPATTTLALEADGGARVGETLRCPIRLSTTGEVQGLSISLAWDSTKVRPLAVEAGEWMVQAGGLVLSPRPGTVDAAFLGPQSAGGEGVVATVSFLTVAAGDPGVRIASVDARDASNRRISIPVSLPPLPRVIPAVTSLALAAPNPFRDETVIAFDLAHSGPADLTIYSPGGRRVRTLLAGTQEPGEYRLSWDGRDEHGNAVAAGVYYLRLVAGGRHYSRPIVRLR